MGKNNQAKRKSKKHKKDTKRKQGETRRQLRLARGKRACNGCTECCSVLGVKPLEKPPWVPCEHLCEEGCGIYKERPGICGEFNCLWQCGLGTAGERPDKLGVVFAPTDGPTLFTGEDEIQAFEGRPGALNSPAAVLLCRKLVKGGALVIGLPHGTAGEFRFMGPKKKVLAARVASQLAQQRIDKIAEETTGSEAPEEPAGQSK